MSISSASCTCGGKKNCFSCLVAGNVKPPKPTKTVPSVKVVHQATQSFGAEGKGQTKYVRVEETHLAKDSGVVCADCDVVVKNLEKHRSKVHGVHAEGVKESLPRINEDGGAPINLLFTLQKCTICGSLVSDMAKHMKKAKHVDEAKKGTRLVMQTETGEMICPFCTSRWPNRAEVSSHVERAHGKHARAGLRFPPARE